MFEECDSSKRRSSLIYNKSVRHEPHVCDTSDTSATWVQHECNTSETRDTSATQVRHEYYMNNTSATQVLHEGHEWKIIILITTLVKT